MDTAHHGNIKTGKDGNPVRTNHPRIKGRVNGLSQRSAPEDFVSSFLALKITYIQLIKKSGLFLMFLQCGQIKAALAGASEGGSCYYDWK